MNTLIALGDSQTDKAAGYGVGAFDCWPALLQRRFDGWQARNYGIAGNTTQQMLDRADVVFMHEVPDLFVLAGGVNDPGASISSAQTTINTQAILMAVKHRAVGRAAGVAAGVTVAAPANLPANAQPGQRMVVLTDADSTGGVAAFDATHAPTITGSVSADANGNRITVWEYRYPIAGVYGWGRVATRTTAPSAVSRSVVVPPPYRNWTTGGDTLTTPLAGNLAVRNALTAAVAVENVTVGGAPSVIYSDLYAFLKARIQGGTDPDFSSVAYSQARSWHYVDSNQHYSAYGHALQAQKIGADLVATWPTLVD